MKLRTENAKYQNFWVNWVKNRTKSSLAQKIAQKVPKHHTNKKTHTGRRKKRKNHTQETKTKDNPKALTQEHTCHQQRRGRKNQRPVNQKFTGKEHNKGTRNKQHRHVEESVTTHQ